MSFESDNPGEQNEAKADSAELDSVDAKIALLLIESPALTDRELAEKLGISRQTANRRRNGSAVNKLVRATLALPEKEIRRVTIKALARLESMLDDEDPRIKLAAAISFLKLNSRILSGEIQIW